MFRGAMDGRGSVKDADGRRSRAAPNGDSAERRSTRSSPSSAATPCRRAADAGLLTSKRRPATAEEFIDAARVLVFLKGNDAHDYKFSSAVLEDYYHVSPEWRNKYLARNMFKLRSALGRRQPPGSADAGRVQCVMRNLVNGSAIRTSARAAAFGHLTADYPLVRSVVRAGARRTS